MLSGGDIKELSFSNPDAGSRTFYAKSSEDSTYDLGGIRTNDDPNMIDGAGRAIYQKNRARWSFAVKCAWDMSTEDLEYLNALSESNNETTMLFTNINDIIYSGSGTIVGDIQGNGNSSTIDIKASGGGVLQIL